MRCGFSSPLPHGQFRAAGILSKSARPKSLACYSFISEIRNAIIEANMHVRRKGKGTSVPLPFAGDFEDGIKCEQVDAFR